MVKKLIQYELYTRKEAHDIFDPTSTFVISTGTWGLQGIVPIKSNPGDYVFFVTIGKKVSNHTFIEEVFEDGSITWQSQPNNDFKHKYIKDFIKHDADINNIYLFLRTEERSPYAFMGTLEYVSHDNVKEKPVYFMWHIFDFDDVKARAVLPNLIIKSRSGIVTSSGTGGGTPEVTGQLILDTAPAMRKKPSGVGTSSFTVKNVDFQGEAKKNSDKGKAGEDAVIQYEKDRLIAAGYQTLAEKVVATRDTIGNTAKYDVTSYETSGAVRFIEVKTTTGSKNSLFHISEGEVKFSEAHPNDYYLYRIYNFDPKTNNGTFYIEQGPIDRTKLTPTNYII